jgi:hypothetical protein
MTYTCKVCDVTSDAAEFYKGLTSRCKECHKRKVKENRDSKADYYKEYDAKRFKEDPKVRARHRRYSKTKAGKASNLKSQNLWRKSNPDKRAAHVILNNAIRAGRVGKPKDCSKCGAGGRIEGHHHDYTRPLDVVWLCRQCHVKEHKETA